MNGILDQRAFPYVKDAPTSLVSSSSMRASPVSPSPITPTSGSLRSAKPSWHKATPKNGIMPRIRERVLVFVAGGMTYSEMREVYSLSKSANKDIIIGEYPRSGDYSDLELKIAGSTHTITPKHFMEDTKSLELGGVGSRALPNGLRSGPSQRSFQEFYDEKYFTRDQAPPKPQPQQQQPPGKGSNRKILTKHSVPPLLSSSSSNGNGTGEKKKKRFF